MEKVFAYGTLADPAIQEKLFGRLPGVKFNAKLMNWAKKTDKEYPYIVPEPGKSVEGKVILLTSKELMATDEWEQVPEEYIRKLLKVETKVGRSIEAWVYVAAPNGTH